MDLLQINLGAGRLSDFVRLFHQRRQDTADATTRMTIQETVNVIISSATITNAWWDAVIVDGTFIGEDEEVFDAVVSSEGVTCLEFEDSTDARSLSRLLSRALPRMANLESVQFNGCPMGTLEAQQVFQALQPVETLSVVGFDVHEDYNLQVFKEFSRFVRTSTSLEVLILSSGFTESISLEAFHFMVTAIGQSSSLKMLRLMGAPSVQAQDLPHVIQSICKAAVDCASLVELLVDDDDTKVRVQLTDQLHKALSLCNAAKNFDFGHRRRNESLDDNDVATLELTRPSPWWSLLSHDIPLKVWPLILAETRLWKAEERSHSTRDIVFFLMKEKSDVLLQNVKKRRIRKRKCYGF